MTKLCPRGKAAAKRKFKVYPSAYANAYASKICAGKIKDPSGVKRKDFRGSKAKGGRIGLRLAGLIPEDSPKRQPNRNIPKGKRTRGPVPANKRNKFNLDGSFKKIEDIQPIKPSSQPDLPRRKKAGEKMNEPKSPTQRSNEDAAMKRESRLSTKIRGYNERVKRAGGGLMEATARLKKQGLKGGGISSRGLGRAFMKGGRV